MTTGQHEINRGLCQPRFMVRTEGQQIMLAVDDDDQLTLAD